MQESIYKVSDTFDQVTMKIRVDWSHPDTSDVAWEVELLEGDE